MGLLGSSRAAVAAFYDHHEQLFLDLLLGAVVTGMIVWYWCRPRSHAAGQWPPAPPGWRPLIGHLSLLGALPHQSLAKLAKQYGTPHLMSLRLGSVRTLVASTPDAARLILQTHDQIFASRPCNAAAILMGFNCSTIAESPLNACWRLMRQLCSTELLSNQRVRSFEHIRVDGVRELLQAVCSQQGKVMEMRPKLMDMALNIMAKMTIGQSLSEVKMTSNVNIDVLGLIEELVHLMGVFNVGDYLPWLGFLDLQGYEKRMKVAGGRWSSLLQELVDIRRRQNAGKESPVNDILDVLLNISSTSPSADITDDNIKGIISDIFTGGTDTIAVTIEWALAELLANPWALRKLQDELDEVVGRERLVQEEDIQNLPYLCAVVKEAFRLHPTAPLLLPHESLQTCQLYTYIVPPRTRVYINVWAIGRDPNTWENPLQFQPNRFLDRNVNVQGMHFQLLPFGSGRRKCPGLSLGLASVQIVLASLVQAFDWALPPPKVHVDLSEASGLSVTMATPLSIIPTPRLRPTLY